MRHAKQVTERSLFWPGFALSLLLLGMVSCGALSMLLNINPIQIAQIRSGQESWYPPEPTPDFLPEDDQPLDDSSTVAAFGIGQQVQNLTNSRVNVRRSPGYLGKADDDILYQVMPSAEMEILDEPAEMDGLTWWQIRYDVDQGDVIEGWVAEATASGVQILGDSLISREP